MITLASDFGSPYPAAMRGVIRRESDAEILDVSHDLPRGDPRAAAFWLRFVLPEFPPAVHCAVVDPGVGTDRAAVAVRAGDHVLVAPDNGLALPPARALAADVDGSGRDDGWFSDDGRPADGRLGDDGRIEVFEILVDDPASATFHGRDVFAPAAARIRETIASVAESTRSAAETADGPSPGDPVGDALASLPRLTRTTEFVDLTLPTATVEDDTAHGEVLVVDDFGNAITNVPGSFLHDRDASRDVDRNPDRDVDRDRMGRVRVNGDPVPVVETFADVPPGDRLVTVGSHGYLECDVNDGRGDEAFGLSPGDVIRFS